MLYWNHSDADLSKCNIWMWFPGGDGHGVLIHDNQTLWDKPALSAPDATQEERLTMNRQCAAAVFLIDWEALLPGSDALAMSEYYKGLIALRRDKDRFGFLTRILPERELGKGNCIIMPWSEDGEAVARAVLNPTGKALALEVPGGWDSYRLIDSVTPGTQAQ